MLLFARAQCVMPFRPMSDLVTVEAKGIQLGQITHHMHSEYIFIFIKVSKWGFVPVTFSEDKV